MKYELGKVSVSVEHVCACGTCGEDIRRSGGVQMSLAGLPSEDIKIDGAVCSVCGRICTTCAYGVAEVSNIMGDRAS